MLILQFKTNAIHGLTDVKMALITALVKHSS